MKIAMWSGPRNLSTAMMYAFAARGDCAVWDEPFYAPYLAATGADHPMAAEIMAAHEIDPARVAAACAGPVPGGLAHWYMKHMPHHMVAGFPLDWAEACVNVHLIRHPARVIASYAEKRGEMSLEDIGFPQQMALWEQLPGPVIDSGDIRADPGGALGRLCAEIGLSFSDRMLGWPEGPRDYDGVWAAHWYNAVHRSTGFAGAEGPLPEVPEGRRALLEAALPIYEAMKARALLPG
ncbi:sulfotransferase-like domain-containing protein [Roseicyclus marinus]|uniref:sulfotransferase-like domain-containing protein n=1 Tax=Roseicyclus marinus TaxID=2161673 RepID=UPI00241046C0|nr:HAD family hydrolase [Roseicyclus marinus]MDG3041190.1 HAD family hydrolase [Roseicyclus marinus]